MSSAGTLSAAGPARRRVSKHSLKGESGAKGDDDGPKRVPLACNSCRTRKTRCDGQIPKCSNCAVDPARVCVYVPVTAEENALARAKKQTSRLARVAKKGYESTLKRSGSTSSVGSTSRGRPLSIASTGSTESLKVKAAAQPTRPGMPKKRHTFHPDLRLSLSGLETRSESFSSSSSSLYTSLPPSSGPLHLDLSSQIQTTFNHSAPSTPSYMYAVNAPAWPLGGPDESLPIHQHFRHHTYSAHASYYSSTPSMISPPLTADPSALGGWPASTSGSGYDEAERQRWLPREEIGTTSTATSHHQAWDLPTPPAETYSKELPTSPTSSDWSPPPFPRLTRPPMIHSHSLPASLTAFPITLLPSPQLEEQPYPQIPASYYGSTSSTTPDLGLFSQSTYLDAVSPDQMSNFDEYHPNQTESRTFAFEDSVPMQSRLSQSQPFSTLSNEERHRRRSSFGLAPIDYGFDPGYQGGVD